MGTTNIPPSGADDKRDARDLVIDALVRDEASLLEQLADVQIACDSYRELALAAVHELHAAHREQQQLRQQHDRLADEYQHLRAQIMTKGYAA